jgi:NADPH-dependent 2,4-dienoyl-CoA reductase/sulfur reductase-like enzyme
LVLVRVLVRVRPMSPALRVAVIGCGTTGAATALFLSRAGHAVTVLERVPEPGPVGAGIMMQPSGLLVVRREMIRSMAGTKTGIFRGSLETRMPRPSRRHGSPLPSDPS